MPQKKEKQSGFMGNFFGLFNDKKNKKVPEEPTVNHLRHSVTFGRLKPNSKMPSFDTQNTTNKLSSSRIAPNLGPVRSKRSIFEDDSELYNRHRTLPARKESNSSQVYLNTDAGDSDGSLSIPSSKEDS